MSKNKKNNKNLLLKKISILQLKKTLYIAWASFRNVHFQSGVFTADGMYYRIDNFNSSTEEGKNTTLISKLEEGHPDNKGFGCGYLTGIVSIYFYMFHVYSAVVHVHFRGLTKLQKTY